MASYIVKNMLDWKLVWQIQSLFIFVSWSINWIVRITLLQ